MMPLLRTVTAPLKLAEWHKLRGGVETAKLAAGPELVGYSPPGNPGSEHVFWTGLFTPSLIRRKIKDHERHSREKRKGKAAS